MIRAFITARGMMDETPEVGGAQVGVLPRAKNELMPGRIDLRAGRQPFARDRNELKEPEYFSKGVNGATLGEIASSHKLRGEGVDFV